jgi:hypothetical protein
MSLPYFKPELPEHRRFGRVKGDNAPAVLKDLNVLVDANNNLQNQINNLPAPTPPYVLPYKVYSALLSQNAPAVVYDSNLLVGAIYEITDYISNPWIIQIIGDSALSYPPGTLLITDTGATGEVLVASGNPFPFPGNTVITLTNAIGDWANSTQLAFAVDPIHTVAMTIQWPASFDDFSNMELISGVMNTTGCKFRATSTTPTNWSEGSELTYDGAPYVVSTDANGNLNPFINTIGDIVWSYSSVGVYIGTLAGAFTSYKSMVYPLGITLLSDAFGDDTSMATYVSPNNQDSISIFTNNYDITLTKDGVLLATPIEIKVYN